jgi:hypothetical protein
MKYIIFALLAVMFAAFCLAALPDFSGHPNLGTRHHSADKIARAVGIEIWNRAIAVQTTGQSLWDAESTGFC